MPFKGHCHRISRGSTVTVTVRITRNPHNITSPTDGRAGGLDAARPWRCFALRSRLRRQLWSQTASVRDATFLPVVVNAPPQPIYINRRPPCLASGRLQCSSTVYHCLSTQRPRAALKGDNDLLSNKLLPLLFGGAVQVPQIVIHFTAA